VNRYILLVTLYSDQVSDPLHSASYIILWLGEWAVTLWVILYTLAGWVSHYTLHDTLYSGQVSEPLHSACYSILWPGG